MSRGVVLVVEDDPAIRRGIVDALGVAGYAAIEAETGEQGLAAAVGAEVDLALVDVMLPGMDGFEMLAEVRKSKPGLPVIMVTALGDEKDVVRGLDTLAADDYVVKPFSAHELLARVKAVLRRSAERPTTVGTLTIEGREIDLESRRVRFPDGRTTEISEKGAELLQYLASCRGRAVKREELLLRVWGLDPRGLTTRTIDMHVSRLRRELGDDGAIIKTVRGRGYMLA